MLDLKFWMQKVGELLKSLKDTVAGHTNSISSLNTTVTEHTNSVNSLNTTVSGHTTSISNLNTTVSGHTTSINSHTTSLNSHASRLTTLEGKIHNVKFRYGSAKISIAAGTSKVADAYISFDTLGFTDVTANNIVGMLVWQDYHMLPIIDNNNGTARLWVQNAQNQRRVHLKSRDAAYSNALFKCLVIYV